MNLRVIALVLLAACSVDSPSTTPTQQGLNGMEGMFEFAIDLPWRIEPRLDPVTNRYVYDPVPITIAIHDEDTNVYSGGFRIGDFCKLTVSRYRQGEAVLTEEFAPTDFEWFEHTKSYWPTTGPDPSNSVCFPALADCSGFTRITDTSEWYAMLKWRPGEMLAGYDEILELTADVGRGGDCSSTIELVNYARAKWAEAPLPRFGSNEWLYGDLHYHSQGTDNEGESGYSYRAVVETMGAMGLDFAFATEHASDSKQIVDIDLDIDLHPVDETRRGLRDMNQRRFDWATRQLHGVDGAHGVNGEVMASWTGRPRIPRLFLGEEVDVMPEVTTKPTSAISTAPGWSMPRGNGHEASIFDYATDGFETFGGSQPSMTVSMIPEVFPSLVDITGQTEFTPADTQGFNARHVGRQHVLYFPRYWNQPTAHVASLTGEYGGATRRLVEGNAAIAQGVLPEIKSKQGVAFLAHPLANGGSGPGPGMLPYSDYQYEKVFGQESFSGLQLWNENRRMASRGCFCGGIIACACPQTGDYDVTGYDWLSATSDGGHWSGWVFGEYRYSPMYDLDTWGWQRQSFSVEENLHNGAFVWDRMLRWGLDVGRTARIPWLTAGEPRRMFMAGGSDAHGDFNYRREGYVRATEEANDTALGKVRNLVLAGEPRAPCSPQDPKCAGTPTTALAHSQDQVVDALQQGRFAVTDGPALRILVDRDRNGIINDTDYQMGSVVDLFNTESLPVLVQWESTAEFGAVERIDLYVGVDTTPVCPGAPCPVNATRSRTYAPDVPGGHGVRRDSARLHDPLHDGFHANSYDQDPTTTTCAGECPLGDGYYLPSEDVRGLLTFSPNTNGGQKWIALDLRKFHTATGAEPTRVYIRAFARTKSCDPFSSPEPVRFSGACVPRYAFTNPIWALRRSWTTGSACPVTPRGLDADFDGLPDICDPAPLSPANLGWTRLFGGASPDLATAVAFDPLGGVYVAGSIAGVGRIERDPFTTQAVTATGIDPVLVKYKADGTYERHFQVLGTSSPTFEDIAVDAAGNIYVAGGFSGTMTIAGQTFTATNGDAFVTKLNSNFQVQWTRTLTGAGSASARRLAITPAGEIAITGDFTGQLTATLYSITSEGGQDCFLLRLNPAGTQQSLHQFGGTGNCSASGLAYGADGRGYVAVSYSGTLSIYVPVSTPYVRTSTSNDAAVIRMGAPATANHPIGVTWVGDPTTSSHDAQVLDVAVASTGSVVAVGHYGGNFRAGRDFGTIATLDATTVGRDGFLVTISPVDGTPALPPVWRFGGSGSDLLANVATDTSGHILVTGTFASPTLSTPLGTLSRIGVLDGMTLVLDGSMQVVWQRAFGSTGWTTGAAGAAFSQTGKLAFGGSIVQGWIDDTRQVTSAGVDDGFVAVFKTP